LEWRSIKELNGLYEVSNTGLIRKTKTKKLLTPKLNEKGYLIIAIMIKGEKYFLRVHRLVANAFILNPLNKPQVNHINGIKTDNCIDNLEWVNNEENYKHAIETGLITHNKKPCALLYKGKIIKQFDSVLHAQKETKGMFGNVDYYLKHSERKNHLELKDYKWVYI